MEMMTA